ncbi:MAG TPA: aldo/keto reductase [Syntrophobacteraceae bacterium]|nr:aldo/keto reductase [Syntrophobacteraceae bacterium]
MSRNDAEPVGVIPTRVFGKTGIEVTVTGLGGEGILRTYGHEDDARKVIREAVAQGISYFDCARAYAGSEIYYGLVWSKHPEDRARIFQAGKSAMRGKKDALDDLDHTLRNMCLDNLDLWQIHDVRTEKDLDIISGPGGALEAFIEAKSKGKTRFIGVTGHHDPKILEKAIREWPIDCAMMPINPVEAALGGFTDSALPAALEKGIAVIGMKVLGASHYILPEMGVTPELLTRFALSQPITVAIIGCSNATHVRTLAQTGRNISPLSPEEQQDIVDLYHPYAKRLAFYRGTFQVLS